MTTRRQRWLVGCLALSIGWACGDAGTSLGPTSFDVSGDWYWEESLQDPALSLTCFDSGGITVTQDGPRFTAAGLQNGYCSGPAGTSPYGAPFAMTGGTIEGTTARFRIEPCPYQGTLHGTAPDSVTGTITCTARVQSTVVHLTGTWRFLRDRPDYLPPQVSGDVTGNFTPNFFLLGDSLRITVNATDDRELKFLGYRLTGPAAAADSIAASGTTASHQFSVPVTVAMAGSSALSVFARDRVHDQTLFVDTVKVFAVRGRRARAVSLPSAVRDLVYDAKRARVYLSMFGLSQIAVLDPVTATLGTSITPPGVVAGLDLSPGGDSLLVALENRGAFAVVNLVSSAIDTVHIDFDTVPPSLHHPGALRVAADGQLLVTGTDNGISGSGGQVVSYDLATGTQQRRTDVGTAGAIQSGTLLERAGDRSRVLLVEMGACCPVRAQVYQAASHSFGASTGTVSLYTGSITASLSGGRFLLGHLLFASDLSPAGSFDEPGRSLADPTVISADGARGYLATSFGSWPGFTIRRATDNALLEQSYVPAWGSARDRLALLPDGLTLLGYVGSGGSGATTLYLVDLR